MDYPSAYRRHAARLRRPELRSDRAKRDNALKTEIDRLWRANREVYGAKKVWRAMHRQGIAVARCTVERLMPDLGLKGEVRGRRVRTTWSDPAAPNPLDRVNRNFTAKRPNQLWVADFTLVGWRRALGGVHWFNQQRLLEPIGHIPPAEFEALYERSRQESSAVA